MTLERQEITSSEEHSRENPLSSGNNHIRNSTAVVKELIQMGFLDKAGQLCLSTLKMTGDSPELLDLLAVVNSKLDQERKGPTGAPTADAGRMTDPSASPKEINGSGSSSDHMTSCFSGHEAKNVVPQTVGAPAHAESHLNMDEIVSDYTKQGLIPGLFGPGYMCCTQPGSYSAFGKNADDIGEIIKEWTFGYPSNGLDAVRMWAWYLNVQALLPGVPGSLAELGVHKGNSASLLNFFSKRHGRKLYLLDTFSGFPEDDVDEKENEDKVKAFRDTSIEYVRDTLGDNPLLRFKVGKFPESVDQELADDRYSVVSLDADNYNPTLAGLRFFYPRLSRNGYIFVHDFSSGHWPGVADAVNEFLSEYEGVGYFQLPDNGGTLVIQKTSDVRSGSYLQHADAPVTRAHERVIQKRCWCGGILGPSLHPEYGKCSSCGTLVSLRQVTHDDLSSFYSFKDYWHDHVSESLGYPSIEERAVLDFADRIPVWYNIVASYSRNPGSILEIGCSYGGFLDFCRMRGIKDVVGIEVDEATCKFARRRFGLQNVVSGLFPDVELPITEFDVITGFDLLEHLQDPVSAMNTVKNMLNDGGIFFFQTPVYRGEDDKWERFQPSEHLFLFDERNVRKLFEQAGLRILDILPAINFDDMFIIGCKDGQAAPGVSTRTHEAETAREISVPHCAEPGTAGSVRLAEEFKTITGGTDMADALRSASRLAAKFPDSPELFNFLGETAIQLDKHILAKAIFANVLHRHPDNLDALNDLAAIEILQQNFEKAMRIFNKILSLDPRNKTAGGNLNYLLQNRHGFAKPVNEETVFKEAKNKLNGFLEAYGDNTDVLNELGKLEMLDGNFLRARRLLGKVMQVDPGNQKCREYLTALRDRCADHEIEMLIDTWLYRV